MKIFGQTLSRLRHESGRSQRQTAADLGISQALLSHYENGAREPKLEFVIKICDYYNVTADFLLGRTDQRENTSRILELFSEFEQIKLTESSLIDEFKELLIKPVHK